MTDYGIQNRVALICSYCTKYVSFPSVEELKGHIKKEHADMSEAERDLVDEVIDSIRECEENPGVYSLKGTAEAIVQRCKEVLLAEPRGKE